MKTQLLNKFNWGGAKMKIVEGQAMEAMTNEIMDPNKDAIPALSSKAMFWRPKYLAESLWLEHIPFYFWLVEAQQSNLIFEPELTSGSTYFAMCQAVEKLNLETRCLGVFNPLNRKYEESVCEYNEENYREFSYLADEPLKDCIHDFEDESIDIMILKYSSALLFNKNLMDAWQKKLSKKSVVLIQGSQKKEAKHLCRKLKESYSTFEFTHGNGLLLVCFGERPASKIQFLVNRGVNDSSTRVIQGIYSRLGVACKDAYINKVNTQKIEELNRILDSKSSLIDSYVDGEVKLKSTVDQAVTELRVVKDINETLSANNEVLVDEHKEMESQYLKSRHKLEQLESENEKASLESESLKKSISNRFTELSKLTALLKSTEEALDDSNKVSENHKKQVDQLKQEILLKKSMVECKSKDIDELNAKLADKEALVHKSKSEAAKLKQALLEKEKQAEELSKSSGNTDKLKRIEQQNSLLEKDQEQASNIISDLKRDNIQLEQSVQQRFDELAMLTSMMQEKDAQLEQLKFELENKENTEKKSIKSKLSLKALNQKHKKRKSEKAKLQKVIQVLGASELFDASWYQSQYPESKKYKGGPVAHYILIGVDAGCNPSDKFDTQWYLDTYSDVKQAGVNPLLHFIKFGKEEGREPKL